MALFGTKSLNYNVGDRTLPKLKSARYFPHHLPGEPTLTQMDFELLSEEAKNGKYNLLLEKAMNFALGLEYVNADYDYSNFTAPDLMSNPDINQVGTTTDEAMSFLANMAKKYIDNQSKVYFEHLPYLAKFEEKLSIELNPDQRKFFMLILRVGMGLSLIENNSAASCWSVISGNVYNLTQWINQHPGGPSAIASLCGVDGTASFNAQHRGEGKPTQRLSGYLLGPLAK
jgi:cytochrome b involved in lipid metabolism